MTRLKKFSKSSNRVKLDYSKFDQLDGRHPLQNAVPDSVVLYKARTRKGGKLAFFNYDLAKDMELIPKDHPMEMNKPLEEKLLHTFGIVIINEYDEINNIKFPKDEIREHEFMATRYLQLQHPNKKGETSGDGRSIWNGVVKNNGKTWDVSSCGTGATKLSPATSINEKYYQTGDPSISYGCGYSELDEGLSTALFSEIMYKNEIPTERVLAVIDYGNGIGITVRAYDNLIRPSHMFNYLKQEDYDNLQRMVDYYIDRQFKNKAWTNRPKTKKAQYNYFLKKMVEYFAKISAKFEDEYIFCWLDWDGDNILMDGGIIDYGSIRQFGLFHSEYRYDDIERFSTTILEQKQKAKYIVQSFIQLVDFLNTKTKKNIKSFQNHKELKRFEKLFSEDKDINLALKIGFSEKDTKLILQKYKRDFHRFSKAFTYFERSKSEEGIHEVSDGINWNAIFCMRDILRELPQLYLSRGEEINDEEFIEIIKSTYATEKDLEINDYRKKMIRQFQGSYIKLVENISNEQKIDFKRKLLEISMRSSVINKYDRVTGDSISVVTDKVMNHKPKLMPDQLYKVFNYFINFQIFDPEKATNLTNTKEAQSKLMKGMLSIVRDYREGL